MKLVSRQLLQQHGRLLVWAGGLILFLVIMFWLRVGAGGPVVVSIDDATPLARSAVTFHPTVDAKRRLLRRGFDYRSPVATDFNALIRDKAFARAYQLAYLDSNFGNMRTAVVALRSHVVPLRAGSEEQGWELASLQQEMLDALDRTLLFEAFAFDRLGVRPVALNRYVQYAELLTQLGPVQIDPALHSVDRRLTAARIKMFLLRRRQPPPPGSTPYLDGLFSSFFEGVEETHPYTSYFEEKVFPLSATYEKAPVAEANAAILASEATHLDHCLRLFGPNRARTAASPDEPPCGAEYYAQRHGGFAFPAAILEYNRLQNVANRLNRSDAPEPWLDQPEPAAAATRNFDPAARSALDRMVSGAGALIARIPREAPEATFLIDDLIDDLSDFQHSNRGYLFTPQEIARGADADAVQRAICGLAPVTQKPAYIYDRREKLLGRLAMVGRRCR